MKILLKLILSVLSLLLLLVIGLVLYVAVFLDPNAYKPEIIEQAGKQGMALALEGDVNWQFFPSLGLSVEGASIASDKYRSEPVITFDKVWVDVPLMPLLKKQILVDGLGANRARIHAVAYKNGDNNWTFGKDEQATATAESDTPSAVSLAVNKFEVSDAHIKYEDRATGSLTEIDKLFVAAQNINLEGRSFPLKLSLALAIPGGNEVLDVDVSTRLAFDQASSKVVIGDGRANMKLPGSSAHAVARFDGKADIGEALSYQFSLSVDETNLRDWLQKMDALPDTASPTALSRFSFAAEVQGDDKRLQVPEFTLGLDQSTATGKANVGLDERGMKEVDIALDRLLADDYMPPPSEPGASESSGASDENAILPLDVLDDVDLKLSLGIGQLRLNDLPLSNIAMRLRANKGRTRFDLDRSDMLSGKISGVLKLNTQANTPTIDIDFAGNKIDLEQTMEFLSLSEKLSLSGISGAKVEGRISGETLAAWKRSADIRMRFDSNQLKWHNINIEQKFCELIARFENQGADPASSAATGAQTDSQDVTQAVKTWESFTELRDLVTELVIQRGQVNIRQFNAGVENLALASEGWFNMLKQSYDVVLPFTLGSGQSSEQGCGLRNNFLQNRELKLLRCRGAFSEGEMANRCGLNSQGVNRLVKDYVVYKAKKKLQPKVDKAKSKAKSKLEEEKSRLNKKLGDKTGKLLEGLFKR